MEVISRDDAIRRGLKRYFTGKPCKYDHIAERLISERKCMECARIRKTRRYGHPANDYNIKRRYGISRQEWEAMFDLQGRACAICRTTETGNWNWATDHCHATGIVRGILCGHCNMGLGYFKDRVVKLSSGITYLERTGRSKRDPVRTKPFIWDLLKARKAA
jgi:hypothetical protein